MKFILVQPLNGLLQISDLECEDDSDSSYETMQKAVNGNFEMCTQYFDNLPENVDAWCNEECLFRPDLLPVLTYQTKGMDGSDLVGYLKGNILFTAYNDEGETLGLDEEQINGVRNALNVMPVIGMLANGEFFPTFYKR